jgi:hypothetical protein
MRCWILYRRHDQTLSSASSRTLSLGLKSPTNRLSGSSLSMPTARLSRLPPHKSKAVFLNLARSRGRLTRSPRSDLTCRAPGWRRRWPRRGNGSISLTGRSSVSNDGEKTTLPCLYIPYSLGLVCRMEIGCYDYLSRGCLGHVRPSSWRLILLQLRAFCWCWLQNGRWV